MNQHKHKHVSLKPVKTLPHDQGDRFNLKHHHADITHSTVNNGGSNHGTLEKAPPKKKDKIKPNHFV